MEHEWATRHRALLREKWQQGARVSDFDYTTYSVSGVLELLRQVERETWQKVEKLCDELSGPRAALSDYAIGYQHAMKDISVYAEQQAKEGA